MTIPEAQGVMPEGTQVVTPTGSLATVRDHGLPRGGENLQMAVTTCQTTLGSTEVWRSDLLAILP